MGHSEVDRATVIDDGKKVRIRFAFPHSAPGTQYVIQAIVTQDALAGSTERAVAHTSVLFTPTAVDEPAVIEVPLAEGSPPFDPKVGIEARATASYTCWSTLDGAKPSVVAEGWEWEGSDWAG